MPISEAMFFMGLARHIEGKRYENEDDTAAWLLHIVKLMLEFQTENGYSIELSDPVRVVENERHFLGGLVKMKRMVRRTDIDSTREHLGNIYIEAMEVLLGRGMYIAAVADEIEGQKFIDMNRFLVSALDVIQSVGDQEVAPGRACFRIASEMKTYTDTYGEVDTTGFPKPTNIPFPFEEKIVWLRNFIESPRLTIHMKFTGVYYTVEPLLAQVTAAPAAPTNTIIDTGFTVGGPAAAAPAIPTGPRNITRTVLSTINDVMEGTTMGAPVACVKGYVAFCSAFLLVGNEEDTPLEMQIGETFDPMSFTDRNNEEHVRDAIVDIMGDWMEMPIAAAFEELRDFMTWSVQLAHEGTVLTHVQMQQRLIKLMLVVHEVMIVKMHLPELTWTIVAAGVAAGPGGGGVASHIDLMSMQAGMLVELGVTLATAPDLRDSVITVQPGAGKGKGKGKGNGKGK